MSGPCCCAGIYIRQLTTLAQLKNYSRRYAQKLNNESPAQTVADSITKDEKMHVSQHRSKPTVRRAFIALEFLAFLVQE
jgi:hypothetical protein